MPQPEKLAAILASDPMFANNAKGDPITRERTCECGRKFTQRLLSERFLTIVERKSRHAIDLLTKEIPGYYVPVFCLPCESRDLGRSARMANARAESRPTFGDDQ